MGKSRSEFEAFEEIYETAPETVLMVDIHDTDEFAKGAFMDVIHIYRLMIWKNPWMNLRVTRPLCFSAEQVEQVEQVEQPIINLWLSVRQGTHIKSSMDASIKSTE